MTQLTIDIIEEVNHKQPRQLPDGKYNSKPLDKEYFKKYYHKHYSQEYICPICNKLLLNIQKNKRHEMSKFCLNARNKLEI